MAVAAAVMALVLGGCLEPALELEPLGAVPGKAKHGKCSAMSCTGCCAGGVCLGGNTDEACGYDGRACTRCEATHRCESPGACYPQAMPAASAPTERDPDHLVHCHLIDGTMRCL